MSFPRSGDADTVGSVQSPEVSAPQVHCSGGAVTTSRTGRMCTGVDANPVVPTLAYTRRTRKGELSETGSTTSSDMHLPQRQCWRPPLCMINWDIDATDMHIGLPLPLLDVHAYNGRAIKTG